MTREAVDPYPSAANEAIDTSSSRRLSSISRFNGVKLSSYLWQDVLLCRPCGIGLMS